MYRKQNENVSSIKTIGKYLDQPLLVAKFSRAVPAVLCAGAGLVTAHNTLHAPEGQKEKVCIQNLCVMAGTVGSALIATRGLKPFHANGKQLFKGFEGLSENTCIVKLKKDQTALIDEFVSQNHVKNETKSILEKAKDKILSFREVKSIHAELGSSENGKKFLNKLIPDPEAVTSKDIFGEIGRLSLMGLVPVVGGIAGGVAGDSLTEKNWQKKVPDKIKEGSYQYLANIFLCNVGAGAAIAIMEKMKVKSKPVKAFGMIAGIVLTGVIGGSAIANYLGKKLIDPIFCTNTNKTNCPKDKSLYSERKPEALDIGLHIDDAATVAVLSGLSWIEPALPILYSISGYRAGIGYRNGDDNRHHRHNHHQRHKGNI